MIEDRLRELFRTALVDAGLIAAASEAPELLFEKPRSKEHGDLATPVALTLAKAAGRP